MSKEKQRLPRNPRIKMAFAREEFDFFFQRLDEVLANVRKRNERPADTVAPTAAGER